MRVLLFLAILLLQCNTAFSSNENQDFMRSIGKIYVVVAVIVATFIGLASFMIYLDRKISRLEKANNL